MVLLPDAIQNVEPLAGARVAVVMLFERDAILPRFVRPPRGNHVQREPAIADPIDVGRLLRQQRGQMESRRTATINSIRSVTAASAAAVDHASSEGASTPLISLRLSSAISVRSKPIFSLRCASFFTYAQLTSMFSFSTLRSHPPKTGSQ